MLLSWVAAVLTAPASLAYLSASSQFTVPTGPIAAAAVVALLMTIVGGHGRRHRDGAAVTGGVLLGAVWVLFVWLSVAL